MDRMPVIPPKERLVRDLKTPWRRYFGKTSQLSTLGKVLFSPILSIYCIVVNAILLFLFAVTKH